jgi:hypothetical protein
MIHLKILSENDARSTMAEGELPGDIRRSSRCVAVILTQSWCPDWTWMKGWLERQAKNQEPEDLDIDVYEFEYNKFANFDEFRMFKERTFGNMLIPYVRYYLDGELVSESNQASSDSFLRPFRTGNG